MTLLVLLMTLQAQTWNLETAKGLSARNVTLSSATHAGKPALKVVEASPGAGEALTAIDGITFEDGVIEVEVAGSPAPGAGEAARGFVGVAFRTAEDFSHFEYFYLRPTNGRAEDQVRRNHSAQYASFPAFPWQKLRQETPEKYESYVDLESGVWTKIKIEVKGETARLYVHGNVQPTLIVGDLKLGKSKGGVALWIGPGTVGHFRNLTIRQ